MADGIYLITLEMTDNFIIMMNCEDWEMAKKWFLKFYMSDTATEKNLQIIL